MPPSYVPLPIQAPTGLTAQAFGTPYQSPDDAEKTAAALLAQELANQNTSVNTARNQQAYDNQQQLSNALKQQFGGDTGAMDDTTLKAALQTAGKFALGQQGDLTTALNVQKQTKDLKDSQPLSDAELAIYQARGLTLPPGTTNGDLGRILELMQVNNAGNRVGVMQGGLNLKIAQTEAPGMVSNLIDENGNPKPMDSNQKKAAGDIAIGLDSLLRNSDALSSAISDNRFPIGDPAVFQAALQANIFPALRQLNRQGVRFNNIIKDLDQSQMGDDAYLMSRIQGLFTGQDPATALQRFAAEVAKEAQSSLYNNSGVITPQSSLAFDPSGEQAQLFANYGVFSRGQQRGAQTIPGNFSVGVNGALSRSGVQNPPLANYGAPQGGGKPSYVPLTPQGGILSKEDFLRLHNPSGGS